MRITLITNMELPGGFVLHADTPAEELFLRQFGNVKDRDVVASCGGNFSEGHVWLTVTQPTKRAVDLRQPSPRKNKIVRGANH